MPFQCLAFSLFTIGRPGENWISCIPCYFVLLFGCRTLWRGPAAEKKGWQLGRGKNFSVIEIFQAGFLTVHCGGHSTNFSKQKPGLWKVGGRSIKCKLLTKRVLSRNRSQFSSFEWLLWPVCPLFYHSKIYADHQLKAIKIWCLCCNYQRTAINRML